MLGPIRRQARQYYIDFSDRVKLHNPKDWAFEIAPRISGSSFAPFLAGAYGLIGALGSRPSLPLIRAAASPLASDTGKARRLSTGNGKGKGPAKETVPHAGLCGPRVTSLPCVLASVLRHERGATRTCCVWLRTEPPRRPGATASGRPKLATRLRGIDARTRVGT